MSEFKNAHKVHGRTFSAHLLSSDILYISISHKDTFELRDALELTAAAKEFAKGGKMYNIIDLESGMLPSNEAREYSTSPEGATCTKAHAFVVKSFAQRIMGNYMIKYQKAAFPMKLFNSVEAALKWIALLKKEEENT